MKLCFDNEEDLIEVGIDEAGRGCLSGRVYVGAVILPKKFPDEKYKEIKDLLADLDSWICEKNAVKVDYQKVLGKGQFGTVYKCICNGRPAAAKILNEPMTVKSAKVYLHLY